MNKSDMVDAAILGAGIAGSCMAILLARRGWKVLLVDRRTFPRHKVCGEFLSPEAVDSLVDLGLEARLRMLRPAIVRRASMIFGTGAPIHVQLPGPAWGISRFALDEALHEEARLAGAEVALGTSVAAIRSQEDIYELELRLGSRHTAMLARTVIGAWGGNGFVPNVPNGNRLKLALCPYIGIKTHLTGIETNEELELYFFEGGYLGLSSAGNGIVNAAALLDKRAFRQPPSTVLGWLEAAGNRNSLLMRRLAPTMPVTGSQAAAAPVPLFGEPNPWHNIPLIGDACVTIPPLCGDGMSMAIRSAQLCAFSANQYLAGKVTMEQWEADYTKAITVQFRGPLRWGRLLQRAAGSPQLSMLAAAAANRLPGVVSRLVKATRLGKLENSPW